MSKIMARLFWILVMFLFASFTAGEILRPRTSAVQAHFFIAIGLVAIGAAAANSARE